MDRRQHGFSIGPDGKPKPPYPRLLFFGTRVMPIIFGAMALQIAVVNYLYPMTDQQRLELELQRQGPRRFNNNAASTDAETQQLQQQQQQKDQQRTPVDDTRLLSPESASTPIDLSHLDRDEGDKL